MRFWLKQFANCVMLVSSWASSSQNSQPQEGEDLELLLIVNSQDAQVSFKREGETQSLLRSQENLWVTGISVNGTDLFGNFHVFHLLGGSGGSKSRALRSQTLVCSVCVAQC